MSKNFKPSHSEPYLLNSNNVDNRLNNNSNLNSFNLIYNQNQNVPVPNIVKRNQSLHQFSTYNQPNQSYANNTSSQPHNMNMNINIQNTATVNTSQNYDQSNFLNQQNFCIRFAVNGLAKSTKYNGSIPPINKNLQAG